MTDRQHAEALIATITGIPVETWGTHIRGADLATWAARLVDKNPHIVALAATDMDAAAAEMLEAAIRTLNVVADIVTQRAAEAA